MASAKGAVYPQGEEIQTPLEHRDRSRGGSGGNLREAAALRGAPVPWRARRGSAGRAAGTQRSSSRPAVGRRKQREETAPRSRHQVRLEGKPAGGVCGWWLGGSPRWARPFSGQAEAMRAWLGMPGTWAWQGHGALRRGTWGLVCVTPEPRGDRRLPGRQAAAGAGLWARWGLLWSRVQPYFRAHLKQGFVELLYR